MFLSNPSRNDSTLTIGCSRHASCLTRHAFVEQCKLLRNSQSSSPAPQHSSPIHAQAANTERVSLWGSSAFAFCHPRLCWDRNLTQCSAWCRDLHPPSGFIQLGSCRCLPSALSTNQLTCVSYSECLGPSVKHCGKSVYSIPSWLQPSKNLAAILWKVPSEVPWLEQPEAKPPAQHLRAFQVFHTFTIIVSFVPQ